VTVSGSHLTEARGPKHTLSL